MTEPRVWSVTQVNRAVRVLLEDTIESLWVSGEVANWTPWPGPGTATSRSRTNRRNSAA